MRIQVALIVVFAPLAASRALAQAPLEVSGDVVAVQNAVVAAIERCEQSVVAIQGTRIPATTRLLVPPNRFAPLREGDLGDEGTEVLRGEFGTGVILDAAGLVLTHFEVIRDANTIEVTTADRKRYAAEVVGADQRSGLAVLRIQASGLPAVRLGDARQVRKGEFVIALGNPYGIAADGQASASFGIVANVGRKSAVGPRRETATLGELGWLIQTDAKLNLGTSGGALVNLRGELIGLTTAVAATAGYDQAAGYAVPVDNAFRRIIDALREGREVEYGLLGVYLENMGDRVGLWGPGPQGALIRDAMPGGPAHRAGLRAGDVITRVDDKPIRNEDDLMLTVSKDPPLSTCQIAYVRDDHEHSISVQLSKAVPLGEQVVTAPAPTWRGLRVDFATAIEEFAAAAQQQATDPNGCVAIRHVEPHSAAWNAGLRSGSFISHVGVRRVESPEEFYTIANRLGGEVRVVVTLPENESREVVVKSSS